MRRSSGRRSRDMMEGFWGMKEENSFDSVSVLKAIQLLSRRKDVLEILTEGFCERDKHLLQSRFEDLSDRRVNMLLFSNDDYSDSFSNFCPVESLRFPSPKKRFTSYRKKPHLKELTSEMSYSNSLPAFINNHQHSLDESEAYFVDDEYKDMSQVRLVPHIERINGKPVDITSGLELYARVFNEVEQKRITDYVYKLQQLGKEGKLRARTYSEPKRWMRGKGRVTIQFGCAYNYAQDKKGNPPGIMRDEEVDPLPALFKKMIKRLVRWNVMPAACVPNSCIVNIYDEEDCIPPHIDHHDFVRPFCTVSLLTECNIVFGSNLKIKGPGEFSGPVTIPLPVGSVLVLNGNGSDVAKHCVPSVPSKRISITFRKMDDSKLPFKFKPDPELEGLEPLPYFSRTNSSTQQVSHPNHVHRNKEASTTNGNSYHHGERDFPWKSSGRSRPSYKRH